jgi:hypothetical protein
VAFGFSAIIINSGIGINNIFARLIRVMMLAGHKKIQFGLLPFFLKKRTATIYLIDMACKLVCVVRIQTGKTPIGNGCP